MKKVVISCGPIPARLDSVKFITNRFKGGLAFSTARCLALDERMKVTVVKWVHTNLPCQLDSDEIEELGITVVDVNDVVEYAKWFEDNAANYDAFVMAAAVANLMPSEPYETKFPSHMYKVGEQFDIKFEIAPRAIDIVKKVNPRCCLIGYKLFDAETDEELIEIARHTLKDAKANVVFANTPAEAKSRKIAVTADGAAIPMNFHDHIKFMTKAIFAEYFRTEDDGHITNDTDIVRAKALVSYFEKSFPEFGTAAVRIKGVGMVTTSRGHSGSPVIVTNVDFENRIVSCAEGRKATLNAPLLWKMLEKSKSDYIVHRHFDDPLVAGTAYDEENLGVINYEFPGTVDEVNAYLQMRERWGGSRDALYIKHHGYVIPFEMRDVDWGKYYRLFPERYFGTRPEIEKVLEYAESHPELESLEIGGNSTSRCKYNLDPNMEGDNVLDYDDIQNRKFDIIVARNSINYLSVPELQKVMASLKDGGTFVANGFAEVPNTVIRCEAGRREVAVTHYDDQQKAYVIDHFLIADDIIYTHSFYGRGEAEYNKFGFNVVRDGNSILISKGALFTPMVVRLTEHGWELVSSSICLKEAEGIWMLEPADENGNVKIGCDKDGTVFMYIPEADIIQQ